MGCTGDVNFILHMYPQNVHNCVCVLLKDCICVCNAHILFSFGIGFLFTLGGFCGRVVDLMRFGLFFFVRVD